MNDLLKLIPDGTYQVIGFLFLLFTFLFKEQIGRKIFKQSNPNFQTLEKQLNEISTQLMAIAIIIDERLKK